MRSFTAALLVAACLNLSGAASWPQFRGPNCSGVAADAHPPVVFNPGTNLAWKVPLPSGISSPCISAGRIFLTGFEGEKLLALCFDARTGKELWRREAPPGKLQAVHKISSQAVASAAANESLACFYFVPFGLVAYNFEGREQWRKPVPITFVINGSGTSPILAGDMVLVNCDQDEGESYLLAVDARTGKTRWQTPRPGFFGSYSTPVTWSHDNTEEVVVAGNLRAVGYDLKTGKERWTAGVLTSVGVSGTPALGGGQLYVSSRATPANAMGTFAEFAAKNDKDGDGKVSRDEAPRWFVDGNVFRALDRDKDGFLSAADWSAMTEQFAKGDSGLFALRPGHGDITTSHVSWKATKGAAGIASPLFYAGRVYAVQDGGRLSCWKAADGKALFEQERLGADGEYYASPVAANGNIYLTSARGVITAVRAADSVDIASRNPLGEAIMATPAIAGDTLYVRSEKHLWAFKK